MQNPTYIVSKLSKEIDLLRKYIEDSMRNAQKQHPKKLCCLTLSNKINHSSEGNFVFLAPDSNVCLKIEIIFFLFSFLFVSS